MGRVNAYIDAWANGTVAGPVAFLNAIVGIDTAIVDWSDQNHTFLSAVSAAIVAPAATVTGVTFSSLALNSTGATFASNSGTIRKLLLCNWTGNVATSRVLMSVPYGPTTALVVPNPSPYWGRF